MKHLFPTKVRRLTALLLTIILITCLVGCRKDDDTGSTDGSQDPLPSASTEPSTQTPPETTTEAPTEVTTIPTTEAPTEPTQTEPTSGKTMGTVTASELNIRKQPGTQYKSVGSYVKGDRVEILEVQGDWGRTDKGWISMEHVKLDKETDEEDDAADDTIESDGKTAVKGYGVVTIKSLNVRTGPGTKYDDVDDVTIGQRYAYYQKSGSWVRIEDGWVSTSYFYLEGTTGEGAGTGTVIDADLNVRSGPGKDFERVGGLKKGETVKILAQVNGWGYTGKGWVSMTYVKMDSETDTDTVIGTGTVTASSLNIRKEPAEGAEKVGAYTKGDTVKILEIKNGWGRTNKGWVSMEYVKMDSSTGTVTASTLNIRKEPDEDAEKVGYYEKGDEVKILETKGDWGRTDKGWISLEYVKMDS